MDGSKGGINVIANNVTLDLMGFTLDGSGTDNYGINFSGYSNVLIKNGTVLNFGNAGIYQSNGLAKYATLLDVKALNNGSLGSDLQHSGIYIWGSNNHIERCTAGNNGGHGIVANSNSKLIDNIAYANTGAFSRDGISGGSDSYLRGNVAYNNRGTGIYGGDGSILINNTSNNNSDGIIGGTGASIQGNTARNNLIGISGISNNTIRNNTVSGNSFYGLYINHDSLITTNTMVGNASTNIIVTGTDNVLIENLVTDSTNGINFVSTGNYYRNNTASGNGTNYANNIPTGSGDGGGNVSF